MNKELIKKYKAEFDHWLDGGKLLQKQINLVIPTEWEEFAEDWDWPIDELVVIINDEYVEFRKALAEGKIIQYRNLKVNVFKNWQDLGNLKFNPNFEHRIKPEEPKFKVGDWVRDGKNIYQFIEPSSIYSYELSLNRCELWQPQPGEWCWFWENGDKIPSFGKLTGMTESGKFFSGWGIYDYCEPFIGELPTNLKDKNES